MIIAEFLWRGKVHRQPVLPDRIPSKFQAISPHFPRSRPSRRVDRRSRHAFVIPGWHGGPSQADSLVPLAIASEALSVEGANPLLRSLIERSKKSGQPNQNQDMTRMVRKLFEEVIK